MTPDPISYFVRGSRLGRAIAGILLSFLAAAPAFASQYIYFAPTPPAVADAMLRLAQVGPEDVVFDLGSGDGRLVNLAAARYGARGVGIEQDANLVEASRQAAREQGIADKVTFVHDDFFTADVSAVTVVLLYLSPSVNRLIEPKLRQELRPGTRIVSHQFPIGEWAPLRTVRTGNDAEIFLWTVPRRPSRAPDVAFTATPRGVVDAMLTLAGVTAADRVFDLGSGDGRIVILAAQKYGARAVGIEMDPPLVELARQVAREGQVEDRARFVEADMFTADLTQATVVILALSAPVNARLAPLLMQQLPPGARVVSYQFPVGEWTPEKTVPANGRTELFLYRMPAR